MGKSSRRTSMRASSDETDVLLDDQRLEQRSPTHGGQTIEEVLDRNVDDRSEPFELGKSDRCAPRGAGRDRATGRVEATTSSFRS